MPTVKQFLLETSQKADFPAYMHDLEEPNLQVTTVSVQKFIWTLKFTAAHVNCSFSSGSFWEQPQEMDGGDRLE